MDAPRPRAPAVPLAAEVPRVLEAPGAPGAPDSPGAPGAPPAPLLRASGLGFGWAGRTALFAGVSFDLAAGQALCLLGPNGAGKTTLLRCLLGLLPPTAGAIVLDGRPLARLPARERARRLAYVPQGSATAFPFSAWDVVLMGRTPHLRFMADPTPADHRAARAAMERLAIAHLAARPFDELSGGERQLTLLARALAQGAPVLVLDEPTAGLDLNHQVQVLAALAALAAEGHALLVSTHGPEQALALGARVLLLGGGCVQGPAAAHELLTADALSRLYGTEVELLRIGAGAAAGQAVCVPVLPTLKG